MLAAALRDGTAHRRTTFEVFARRLPEGRRYGVVAGTARFVEALAQFRFDDAALPSLSDFLDPDTLEYLARLPIPRRRRRLRRRRVVLPRLPGAVGARHLRRVRPAGDAGAVDLQPRHRDRLGGRAHGRAPPRAAPLIEMGSRRTHEQAAVAAARAAYIAGFAGSSNLEAQRRYGVPALGTSAHAFTLLHTSARPGPTRRRRSRPRSTRSAWAPRCSSTPTTSPRAWPTPSRWPARNSAPSASTPATSGVLARQVRDQLDGLGAHEHPHRGVGRPRRVRDRRTARRTRRHLRRRHVGGHRFGRADRGHGLQAGRGRRHPGGEAQQHKESHGGRKQAPAAGQAVGNRRRGGRPSGRPKPHRRPELVARALDGRLVRDGEPVADLDLDAARDRVEAGLHSLPWDGLKLSRGEPAIPTRMIPSAGRGA